MAAEGEASISKLSRSSSAPEELPSPCSDYGFDPLGLSVTETVRNRLVEGEVMNGRFAMLAVVGAIVPELLGKGNFGDIAASAPFGSTILGLEPVGVSTPFLHFD